MALGLYVALFVLAAVALVAPRPGWFIAAFLAIMAVFCLADQTRWQPWVFQYSFLLAAIALLCGQWRRWRAAGAEHRPADRRLHLYFLGPAEGQPEFRGERFSMDRSAHHRACFRRRPICFTRFGMAVPLVQVAFGIGLLTRRFRRVSLIAAVAMHLFILAMFGPAGLDWNDIVWPWTAAMAIFDVAAVFRRAGIFVARDRLGARHDPGHVAAVVLFAVLPCLEFLQSLGFLPVLGALFRQSDGGANLSVRRRSRLVAGGDQVALWCGHRPTPTS